MDKEFVKATLLELAPALKAAGITHIALHGSVVRGEARWDSDVDLLYEFDQPKLSLIGVEKVRNMISDRLGGAAVDLSNRRRLRANIKPNAEREAELVF